MPDNSTTDTTAPGNGEGQKRVSWHAFNAANYFAEWFIRLLEAIAPIEAKKRREDQVRVRALFEPEMERIIQEATADLRARLVTAQADAAALRKAAKLGEKWMNWWLQQNECECDGDHVCGRPERQRELDQIRAALASTAGTALLEELSRLRAKDKSGDGRNAKAEERQC